MATTEKKFGCEKPVINGMFALCIAVVCIFVAFFSIVFICLNAYGVSTAESDTLKDIGKANIKDWVIVLICSVVTFGIGIGLAMAGCISNKAN